MSKLRIGRHINISHGFLTAVHHAHSLGCNIMQIFLGPPQRISFKARSNTELHKFGLELQKYDMEMVIHGSYAINLCHPAGSARFKSSIKSLQQDLMAASLIGDRCAGVIIHMGKNIADNKIDNKTAIDNYIIGLKTALKATPFETTIILETGASQGTEVGSKIDGLATIYWSLTEKERERITFCIDTCHIWATGYDISTTAGVNSFFKEFDKKLGIDKIACIHFNDSKTALNSHVDRHADLAYGFIGEAGLKAFAHKASKYQIPIIMETPLDAIDPRTNREVTFANEFAKLKTWIK